MSDSNAGKLREKFQNNVRWITKDYLRDNPDEAEYLKFFQDFLSNDNQDIGDRKNIPAGHMCANLVIVDRDKKKILMIFHKALNKWLTPGGHFDYEDEFLDTTAYREAYEETGVSVPRFLTLGQLPVYIDYHDIPESMAKKEATHMHFVFYYMALASADSIKINLQLNEVSEARWFSYEEIECPDTKKLAKKVFKTLGL